MANRRRFVFQSAAVILTLGAPAGARAFRLVEPGPEAMDAIQSACTTSRYHEDLVDNVLRDLAAQGIEMGERDVRQILAVRTCPLCGCSVTARTKPHPTAPSGE
jgi:hypothetical protein